MPDPQRSVRLGLVGAAAVVMFATLFGRLWFLQVASVDDFTEVASANSVRRVELDAPRGRILDRSGRVIVDNRPSAVVTVDRRRLDALNDTNPGAADDLLSRLESLFNRFGRPTEVGFLDRRLDDPRFDPLLPVPVANDIGEDLVVFLREHADEFPAVQVESTWVRHYPYGELAAHVVGYTGSASEADIAANDDLRPGSVVGKTGVERVFDEDLRGRSGYQLVEVDALDNPIRELEATESEGAARPGSDVWLTIDLDLQAQAERALERELRRVREEPSDRSVASDDPAAADTEEAADDAEPLKRAPAGSVVVMEPGSGAVVAMASAPTFRPDRFVGGISQADWAELTAEGNFDPLVNRAIEGLYAPGSTFKPFVATAAVEAGLLDPDDTTWNDRGRYRVSNCTGGSCVFRNAQNAVYGEVDLRRALTVSSDTFFYWLGESFWNERTTGRKFGDPMSVAAKEFGFGSPTGIALPGETSGFVPDPDASKARHDANPAAYPTGDQWFAGNNVITAIGQGEVAVSPIQLANAYGAIANGGEIRSPNIVAEVRAAGAAEPLRTLAPRTLGEVDLAPELRSALLDGLVGVTSLPEGTADRAFAGFPLDRWPVAAKSGTAEVAGKADTSLFAAFGPVDDPEFVVVAVLEEAGFGGDAAAPLVRDLLDTLAGVTPPREAQSADAARTGFLAPPDPRMPDRSAEAIRRDVRAIRAEEPS